MTGHRGRSSDTFPVGCAKRRAAHRIRNGDPVCLAWLGTPYEGLACELRRGWR